MSHCSFCNGPLPEGYTEDYREGLLTCPRCVRRIAKGMIDRGEGRFVNPELAKTMSTKEWFEKALRDGREAFLAGRGRDNVPKRRRSVEGRFFWQCGWDQARAEVEGSPVKKALEQERDLEKMLAEVRIERREGDE